ncbi:hypothetical protein ABET52_08635 [Saccharococcus caldoxylosilyticus]|uniref:Uncharacterized protein n=1 Tax=Saccharococcus caldoxylosilyticus TaxID=81408 RepID=A0A150L5E6_9BACL|nr:hypothetical protein [Parageobacillus caldoxylosilyticus]KYD07528.1 hypothetical protein B4119_2446 [Parageobacillus caldoxylosilyticus]
MDFFIIIQLEYYFTFYQSSSKTVTVAKITNQLPNSSTLFKKGA